MCFPCRDKSKPVRSYTEAVNSHSPTDCTNSQSTLGVQKVQNVMDCSFLDMGDLVKCGRGVYLIKNEKDYIVKILRSFVTTGEEQVQLFNSVYGHTSAKLIDVGNDKGIIMVKLNGKPLDRLGHQEIPENLIQLVIDCLSRLRDKGIIHEDLELHNLIYDNSTNKVNAVDITNALGKDNGLTEDQLNVYVNSFLKSVKDFYIRKTGKLIDMPTSRFSIC